MPNRPLHLRYGAHGVLMFQRVKSSGSGAVNMMHLISTLKYIKHVQLSHCN